jgi:hypothetical protein
MTSVPATILALDIQNETNAMGSCRDWSCRCDRKGYMPSLWGLRAMVPLVASCVYDTSGGYIRRVAEGEHDQTCKANQLRGGGNLMQYFLLFVPRSSSCFLAWWMYPLFVFPMRAFAFVWLVSVTCPNGVHAQIPVHSFLSFSADLNALRNYERTRPYPLTAQIRLAQHQVQNCNTTHVSPDLGTLTATNRTLYTKSCQIENMIT